MSVDIAVYADWDGLPSPWRLGVLRGYPGAARETFEFAFDAATLNNPALQGLLLDPQLRLLPGRQYPAAGHDIFGLFADASPDRWGRMLMRRRHERAQRAGAVPKGDRLHESDYLLGVHDRYRVGALRFKRDDAGDFLDDQHDRAAPPMVRLRALEAASLALERHEEDDTPQVDEWLRLLIAPGGSLGGARPKASVVDTDDRLWIAKFPSVRDDHDVGAWEFVLHTLAERCGLSVPGRMLRRFAGSHHSFVVRRFDREAAGRRLHVASAMTLTGRRDGDDASTGASYLDLAHVLVTQGAETRADLQELWSRIVFNMLVSNTDDHLRNHAFILLPGQGWRLSPAYDMNPVVASAGLKLNVSRADNALDLELARSVAPLFHLRLGTADDIIERSKGAVRQWRQLATEIGLSARAQARMAAAFRLAGSVGANPAAQTDSIHPPTRNIRPMPDQHSLDLFDTSPAASPTDRLFFAVFPDATTAERIAALAQRLRGAHGLKGNALKTDRFHVTLHHVGDYAGLPPGVVADAMAAASSVVASPFEVRFDRAVSFRRKTKLPFVLRGDEGLQALMSFQQTLGAAMVRHRLGPSVERNFTPHVTLLYDNQAVPTEPVEAIEWTVGDFMLVHSLIGKTKHLVLGRWPLPG